MASSNEGDLVLDPFCGCGTTITVAEGLKRRWIGIDITHLAITLIKKRLHDSFGEELARYEVVGEPVDAKGAEALAETNRHQFEWWALGLIDAAPAQDKKKGADRGVDGVLYFQEKDDGPYQKIIVQVKSGHVNAAMVRDLKGVMLREKAATGLPPDSEAPHPAHERGGRGRGFLCAGAVSGVALSTAANPHHRRTVRRQAVGIPPLGASQNLQKGGSPPQRPNSRATTK